MMALHKSLVLVVGLPELRSKHNITFNATPSVKVAMHCSTGHEATILVTTLL